MLTGSAAVSRTEDVLPGRPLARLHCSFCGQSQDEVEVLVAAPAAAICDQCVTVSQGEIDRRAGRGDAAKVVDDPRTWPVERHIFILQSQNSAFERLDTSMQATVDVLREREVSWAAIGDALGVSRQAAWKRFG
jgi:hypothetical protein